MRTDKAAQLEEIRKLEKKCENGHGSASKIKRKRKRKRGRGARRNDKTGRAIDDRPTVGEKEEMGSCVVSCPYGGRERALDRMGVGTPSVSFADSSGCGARNSLLAYARRISTAAPPYCSLYPPQAALANVPPKGAPRGGATTYIIYTRARVFSPLGKILSL